MSSDRGRSPISFTLPLTTPSNHDPADNDIDEQTPTNTSISHIGRTSWDDQDSMTTPTHDATPTDNSRRTLSYSSLPEDELDDMNSEPSRGGITTQIKRLFKRKKKHKSDLATIYSEGTYHSDYSSQQKRRSASLSSHESTSLKSWRIFSSKKTRQSDPLYDTLPVQPVVVLNDTEEHVSSTINI